MHRCEAGLTNSTARKSSLAKDPPWHVYLVFDGGSLGNPGQGYGSFVYKGVINQLEPRSIEFPGQTTNNEAEYRTLVAGLETALENIRSAGSDPANLSIAVKSDSKLVVEQVNGNWKVKKAELKPLVRQVLRLLQEFRDWTLSWHPRSESVRILGH
jgi:ribonuclease HI